MNIAVQFDNIDSDDGSFTIGETIFTVTATENDQIYALDAEAWNLSQFDKQGDGLGWVLYPAGDGAPEYFKEFVQKRGDFLYYAPADSTAVPEVTLAGQIASGSEQSVTFEPTATEWMFSLVNPFPIDTTWGDLNTFTKENDVIVALDAEAWNLSQYDRQPDGEGWILHPAGGGASEYFTDESAVALKAGEAAYYIPTETVTWTVTL